MKSSYLRSLMLLGILSTFLLTACGMAQANKPKSTPTPLPPTATPILNSVYTSPDGLFQIKFPGNWAALTSKTQSPNIVDAIAFGDNANKTAFLATSVTSGIPTSLLPMALQGGLTAISGVTQVNVSNSTSTFPSGLNSWTRADATFDDGGTPSIGLLFGLNHNGHAFFCILIYPTESKDVLNTTLLPMLASLKFLK